MAAPYPSSQSELSARVVALEAGLNALRQVLDERDTRYAQRAASQDAAVKSALETSEKAIIKTDTAVESRFQGVNEFRQTLADQAATLMPRAEFNVQHGAILDKVDNLVLRVNQLQQEVSSIQARGGGIKEVMGYIIAAVIAIATISAEYFRR